MSSVSSLHTLFSYEIGDPNKDEIAAPTGATSQFIVWLNYVVQDIARLTDCLQTSVVVTGDATAEAFAIPTSGLAYITILDFADIETENATVTVTVNGTASVLTEDAQYQAGASNNACATSLAAALEAVTGLTASASSAVVTVRTDPNTSYTIDNLVTSTATTNMTISLGRIWRVLRVTDKTNEIIYRSVTREEFQGYRNNIVGNSLSDVYVYSVFGYDSGRYIYLLPVVASAIAITIEASSYPPTIVYTATAMPGLLNQDDSILLKGLAALYWNAVGDTARATPIFNEYFERVKRLSSEVGINPVIKPEMSSLWQGGAVDDTK